MNLLLTSCLLSAGMALPLPQAPPITIELAYSKKITAAFTGRVLVIVSKQAIKENERPPTLGWLNPYPFFAQEVVQWPAEQALTFEPKYALKTWEQLPREKVYLQAVLDRDLGGMNFYSSPGNAYSKPVVVDLSQPPTEPVKLLIDQLIAEPAFAEKPRVKYVELQSKLLSKFHGKPIKLRAGVLLPASFTKEPAKKYPVIYEIPGFGGTHHSARFIESRNPTEVAGVEMLYVVLDPSCRLGHHVFADSANNGPYGRALVEEFIPYIEAKFRGIGTARARFVTGHSSGGWSSLWLQITYPDFFGGVWSTAPDPVDFRDFQRVDLYDPTQNLFVDDKGQQRPLARSGKKVTLYFKPFNDMEVVMGRGGQLFSFEAVFSPRGPDGQPRPLWDRSTGVIDREVAASWQRYDIRLILEQNWDKLGPKLAGKLHVYMGAEDTYYLEGATRLLQQALRKLGSDAMIEIFPGRNHGNLIDTALRQRMAKEMADAYRKHACEK